MIILPAVDLLDGKVVRLTQGRRDAVTVYSDDPVAMAKRWVAAGATWLHVVDLNGAFDGTYSNLPVARRIIEACGIQVELSGGIRTKEALSEALGAGAARVVLGTKACEDPAFVQAAADAASRLPASYAFIALIFSVHGLHLSLRGPPVAGEIILFIVSAKIQRLPLSPSFSLPSPLGFGPVFGGRVTGTPNSLHIAGLSVM